MKDRTIISAQNKHGYFKVLATSNLKLKCYFLWSANAEEIAVSGLKQIMILVIDFIRTEGLKELSTQVILP